MEPLLISSGLMAGFERKFLLAYRKQPPRVTVGDQLIFTVELERTDCGFASR
jgi:hypothetical protein